MKNIIDFAIENRASIAAAGSAILGLVVRAFEKKKVKKKYENIIAGMNGSEKK